MSENKRNKSSPNSINNVFPEGRGEPCLVVIPKEIGSNPWKLAKLFGLKPSLSKDQIDAMAKGFEEISRK